MKYISTHFLYLSLPFPLQYEIKRRINAETTAATATATGTGETGQGGRLVQLVAAGCAVWIYKLSEF